MTGGAGSTSDDTVGPVVELGRMALDSFSRATRPEDLDWLGVVP